MMFRGFVPLALLMPMMASLALAGPRADELGVDGVYAGTIGMQLATDKGKNLDYKAAAKLVVMPDGNGAILTAQHPEGVVSLALKGEFRGQVFYAESRGRQDYGGYTQGMKWDITFDEKKGTAVMHGKAINLPKWAKNDDYRYTFHKQPAKRR